MSEIFIPGINSRFNTGQIVEDLMRIERIPRDRAERNVERLEDQRTHWQEISRRTVALRDSARHLFSFQHPFNDRIVSSDDSSALTGTAVRGALQQERSFTIQQVAQADRFLSTTLDPDFRVESGTFTFSVGDEEISFDFGGGTLRDFSDALNRRGQGILNASLISVRQGTTSLLIESRVTGEENRLNFSGAALTLGEQIGMASRANDSRVIFTDGVVNAPSGSSSQIPMNFQIPADGNWMLGFETSTTVRAGDAFAVPQPPPGPSIPPAGSVSHGGIVIQNDPSAVSLPPWTPPAAPVRVDNMNLLSVTFADGGSLQLPAVIDSTGFTTEQFPLGALAGGRTIVSLNLVNNNTHRDLNIQNVQVFDPAALGGVRPLNPVSTAQDAIISMEGIQISRASNQIDDLLPGVTITVRRPSDRPVTLFIEPDHDAVKDGIISFVGNFNRLMSEINILTRTDPRVVDELTFLTPDERADALQRLGAFSGDLTLMNMRNNMMRIIGNSFPTSEGRELSLLSQIGIGTDVRWGGATGGIDVSRLRGYLEIDERVLDNAIATRLDAVRELFGSDTTGNRLVDTGVAFQVDAMIQPFTQTGGIFSHTTGSINTRIAQENRRIENLDRVLTQREIDLRRQYAQMEEAFRRMEQMNNSLNQFGQQNSR
jgi:flagellar hook-associated protein 2